MACMLTLATTMLLSVQCSINLLLMPFMLSRVPNFTFLYVQR